MEGATKKERVLFEFLDKNAVTFRVSDMEYPEIRRQFRTLLLVFLGVNMSDAELFRALLGIPSDWGDFVGFERPRRGTMRATLFRAEREPGVNSGDNAVITRVGAQFTH